VITLAFVFTPIFWEVSWLSYPLVARVLGRRKSRDSE
jgi:hypothetical protein